MALALIEGQAAAQCEQKLLASDGATSDEFGHSVSISGTPGNEVAIVGARHDDDKGPESGSAYIYRKSGANWVEEQKLLASDGAANDKFGGGVSISGDVAIVGAYQDNDNGTDSGSVYIFRKSGANWVQETKLIAFDGAAGDFFGFSVSISGTPGNEVVIVGAMFDDDKGTDSGSAYIYRYDPGLPGWTEDAKLLASDGAADDRFGRIVSISGNSGNEVAIVGAMFDDDKGTDSGSSYIYRYDPGLPGWTEDAKLLASNGTAGDIFGISVAISGDVAVVGAWSGDGLVVDSGSAYIYRYDPALPGWPEEAKLLASDGALFDFFGWSVSISGTSGNEVVIVGAILDDDNGGGSGSAYVYRYDLVTTLWVEDLKLLASDGAASDNFGFSVSISSDPGNEFALVGARLDAVDNDDNSTNFGSAYVLELTVCPADTNCSGDVNVTDLLAMLAAWGPCPAPCAADSNSDGNVNVTDLITLLASWGACP